MTFSLQLLFTDDDLKLLEETNSFVAIAKPIETASLVLWQLLQPSQFNSIQFKDEVGIYVSKEKVQNGYIVNNFTNTPIPTAPGTYTFSEQGTLTGPEDSGNPGHYAVQNKFPIEPFMTFGLYQPAQVNGIIHQGIISANKVLHNSTISMTAANKVVVWIESSLTTGAVMLNGISSPTTSINFSPSEPVHTYKYNAQRGDFVNSDM